ncbi:MAG: radical SAM/SPASM domain-containing protein [Candidatus Thorarchaeota archaeon]
MKMAQVFLRQFLDNLHPDLTKAFLPWMVRNPRYLRAALRLGRAYQKAERTRDRLRSGKLRIPPVLIMSITSKCNLTCAGCYATATGTIDNSKVKQPNTSQLDLERWRSVITEARDLGVFGFILAGGEPFLYPGLLELCMEFKDRFFLIVTNGTAMSRKDFQRLSQASNIAVIVSLEGGETSTDARRGPGIFLKTQKTLKHLWNAGVLTGFSSTVTRDNYEYWMNREHLDQYIKQGLRIGVFIEYIPTAEPDAPSRQSLSPCSDNGLMLTEEEREKFRAHVLDYRESKPIIILHSPNDQEYYGGCVSAGRGFAHVTPGGDVTPCPVSNLATHNLQKSSLREALASELFTEIRNNGFLLENHDLPCALLSHQEEVLELAKTVGAYRTDTKEMVS